MDSTPSIYISDIIDLVVKETKLDSSEVESEMFSLYLYPAGENTYFDSTDKQTNWLKIAIAKVLQADNLNYVMFYE